MLFLYLTSNNNPLQFSRLPSIEDGKLINLCSIRFVSVYCIGYNQCKQCSNSSKTAKMQFSNLIAIIFATGVVGLPSLEAAGSQLSKRTCWELKGEKLKICQEACELACVSQNCSCAAIKRYAWLLRGLQNHRMLLPAHLQNHFARKLVMSDH